MSDELRVDGGGGEAVPEPRGRLLDKAEVRREAKEKEVTMPATFEEWYRAAYGRYPNYDTPLMREPARAAWVAATERAAGVWTTTPPTETGNYWLREWWDGVLRNPCAVRVSFLYEPSPLVVWFSERESGLADLDSRSLWAGPLAPPPAPEE